LALREKQIQQNYRPIIAVHKWFARRPGTLFRSLILSEFGKEALEDEYYKPHDLAGLKIADPFMGGGTPLIEANRVGCDTIGYDINPLAWWIVREQIEHLNISAYRESANNLRDELEKKVGLFYQTQCVIDGREDAQAKYYFWVKTLLCDDCNLSIDLFPGYLLAENVRHPKNVFICSVCGELNETQDRRTPGLCAFCKVPIKTEGAVSRGVCKCPQCGKEHRIPGKRETPYEHRLFAIEYINQECRKAHNGRFFKKPDKADYEKYRAAEKAFAKLRRLHVPPETIPNGDETDRLHRWGYLQYRQMFNSRQLYGLELSCRLIDKVLDERLRKALATNLSDLLRYQNMLCRYDTMALKSLDIFSVHGFPVGLIQVESNILGIQNKYSNMPIGSGGWLNIIEKYSKAKEYCDNPFEIFHQNGSKKSIAIRGEWIGEFRNGNIAATRRVVDIQCTDSAIKQIPESSLDAVFTDPPYFGNVQYSELMDFCYVWLRRIMPDVEEFRNESTRRSDELTGNVTAGRGMIHFTEGMTLVFKNMANALKSGSPLAFTFHHNNIQAYFPIAAAILDSGLVCSASLPCPAEMGASIHISGTKSSIIDSIFVCRSTGSVKQKWLPCDTQGLIELVRSEIIELKKAGVKPTEGDSRCMIYGHLIRLAIWELRHGWNIEAATQDKIARICARVNEYGNVIGMVERLNKEIALAPLQMGYEVMDMKIKYGDPSDEIPF